MNLSSCLPRCPRRNLKRIIGIIFSVDTFEDDVSTRYQMADGRALGCAAENPFPRYELQVGPASNKLTSMDTEGEPLKSSSNPLAELLVASVSLRILSIVLLGSVR